MLRNTFCHIGRIGPKTERRLWAHGILSWADARDAGTLPLPPRAAEAVRRGSEESEARLADGDAPYFADRLPPRLHWRLFREFRDAVAYLDIETTGLGGPGDYITAIGLYDGRAVRHYVYEQNLEDFGQDIGGRRLIVTYNGKTFDLPFIRRYMGVAVDGAHVDLRYVLKALGYTGGLKGCERKLGLDRGELDGLDGYFAVLLWDDFRQGGNALALETLLAYNTADIVNLETLMVMAYNMNVGRTPFAQSHRLPLPSPPAPPFRPDGETIRRIRLAHGWL